MGRVAFVCVCVQVCAKPYSALPHNGLWHQISLNEDQWLPPASIRRSPKISVPNCSYTNSLSLSLCVCTLREEREVGKAGSATIVGHHDIAIY